MKTIKAAGATNRREWLPVVLLIILLAVLFGKSLLPDYVHFSNDGPLGQQNAAWGQLPQAFTGCWGDIYNIGNSSGGFPMGLNGIIRWVLGPVGYAKFLPPIALFVLGLGAWCFFRQLQLKPLAATLGALAATLNSAFFASACWGVASQQIAIGMDFIALALVVANTAETPAALRWIRLALAGMAVGVNVVEGADIGAIFSMVIAAYVLYGSLMDQTRPVLAKLGRGVGAVAIIAVFAGFMAAQTIASLIGAQIQGVAGTGQDRETKAQHWNWATQWSLPKVETLGLFVPGVFGYKLDTPSKMPDFLQEAYQGGMYWGGMGRDPELDAYLDRDQTGPAPSGFMRFTGGQNYCGALVVLVALWAISVSLRRQGGIFTPWQQRLIWFWAGVLILSLLLAWGRFAPFYVLLYQLPYFSTIRNPTKFLLIFSWAMTILFAYGIHGLSLRHLSTAMGVTNSAAGQNKSGWQRLAGFERRWVWACAALFGASLVGWMIYDSQKPALVRYLQKVGFGSEEMAGQIAGFSIRQAGWFVFIFAVIAGLFVLINAGVFRGKRAKLGGVLLGALLVLDLVRADMPYVIHWNYKEKYASNPIIDFLRDKPYEHRVVDLRPPEGLRLPGYSNYFEELYRIEWIQQIFPYYNVQSLDIVQRSRAPANEIAYETTFLPRTADDSWVVARRWQLTNTRYLLGVAGYLDSLNGQLDPGRGRFRIVQRFDVVPKPGIKQLTQLEQMTAELNPNGACALFEFAGALPRVKLYANWQVNTNDEAVLKMLADAAFDPFETVLVSPPAPGLSALATNENSGTVEFKDYSPKHIVFAANAARPSVLLLNDKYDPHWRVSVDGQPAPLLRCNFIMRGVYLTPGAHTVVFKFVLPNGPLYVSLAALGVALCLCGLLVVATRSGKTASG
jgi:hypothetical protein